MKQLDEAVTEAILVWRTFWAPPINDDEALVKSWLTMMGDIDVEKFQRAAQIACRKLTFWPKPADILAIVREQGNAPRLYQSLPMPQEAPVTPEFKAQVLAGMKSELGKKMLLELTEAQKN